MARRCDPIVFDRQMRFSVWVREKCFRGKKKQTKEEREREADRRKRRGHCGFTDKRKVLKKKRVRNRWGKRRHPIDLFNTDRWFFGQGLQVVSPLEDAKQQAMIAVLQQPANSRVPRGATETSRTEFS